MFFDAGVPNPTSIVVANLVWLEKLTMKACSERLTVQKRHMED
jgi:hypothetical protein